MEGHGPKALLWVTVGLILASLGLAGCASLTVPKSDQAVKRGHAIALQVCSACHNVDGADQGPQNKAPSFSDPGFRHTSALTGRLRQLTQNGHYAMPPRALSPAQIDDLAAYIGRDADHE